MKQLLQNIRDGRLSVGEVPAPMVRDGEVLIANRASLVSAGTEKMILELSKKSLLGKARERPDHVRRVIEKIRNEGLWQTVRQVREKLDSPMTMGYSSAGVVLACGKGVQEYKVGDRVASNGPHAEVVSVPKHLCARLPDNVSFEDGSFGVLGAIALQGVRLGKVNLGETVFVIGLGLVGQLAVGLANAAGCRVIATDPDSEKCVLAKRMGADVAEPNLSAGAVMEMTGGLGADAVLITASTKSNGPIELSAAAVRQKGRVVLVGVVGLELDRRPFFFKEAEFVVSCSYGPGRYDPKYEERGLDYPAAWVRWTEQRNIQSVLDLMASKKLDVSPLITHRFDIGEANGAYELIETGREPYVGMVLTYPGMTADRIERSVRLGSGGERNGTIGLGVLGAGNFARMVMFPAIANCDAFTLESLCTAKGVSAAHSGKKLGFARATTDEDEVFADDRIGAVFSITQHNEHAGHVVKAIDSGKAIFVEKPLCLTEEELEKIELGVEGAGDACPLVMVGFNRRFSPAARMVKEFFEGSSSPMTFSMRFNAGEISSEHWTQDEEIGGGRIIGEACHGIDLATYVVDSPVVRVFAESVGGETGGEITDDQCFITMRHANGSVSNIAYLAGGDKSYPKERIEVMGGGRLAVIGDFRVTELVRGGKRKRVKGKQDKGHVAEVEAFGKALRDGGEWPISWSDLRTVSLAAICAVKSLREGGPIDVV